MHTPEKRLPASVTSVAPTSPNHRPSTTCGLSTASAEAINASLRTTATWRKLPARPSPRPAQYRCSPRQASGLRLRRSEALSERHPGPCHQVGGYATPMQGPVEYEAAIATLGGGIRGENPHVLTEQARLTQARWTLLAQIDTDDRAEMMWGDCGALYWLTRRKEMTAREAIAQPSSAAAHWL